ncbi:response regulator [Mesorhizobium sp. J428]|uniref:response regulator n=1 Tax=Mesorhizobium sp. J428 TaxID=2898440 RepID=UPI00215127D9|nr:response regulator [Mesorhizobium sp. J428]MCR5856909.1 response regulator [Mesorhizobium sp. J428]
MARLLVVEDDESVRQLAARALQREGHQVEVACDGEEGLARIVQAGGDYDLVVSDIRMPVLDGIEMSHKAAARFPDIKIMLVTGYADQRERAAELEGVVVDVLLKPFTLASIRDVVAKNLARVRA